MNCNYCKGKCIKKGFYKTIQRYQCKTCGRHQRMVYRNRQYTHQTDTEISVLNKEAMSISSISRLLSMPRTSVQRRIDKSSRKVKAPVYRETNQVYEVDELYTYIGRKSNPCYIIYAINRKTKDVIDFVCGARSRENISRLINTLLCLSPKRIYTDKLNVFSSVVPDFLHSNLYDLFTIRRPDIRKEENR